MPAVDAAREAYHRRMVLWRDRRGNGLVLRATLRPDRDRWRLVVRFAGGRLHTEWFTDRGFAERMLDAARSMRVPRWLRG